MKVATFRHNGTDAVGVVLDESIVDLKKAAQLSGEAPDPIFESMLTFIASGDEGLLRAQNAMDRTASLAHIPLRSVELLAPIPRPTKNVFCLGRNYAEHAAESLRAIGQEVRLPAYPNVFTKAITSINGPYADIPFDATVSDKLDWEVELGVIIGKGGRHISREDALEHVWGYTVINDISARDIQHLAGVQFFQGKSLDGSCPIGPWITTCDAVPDPQRLSLHLWVNDALKQSGNTADMLFDVATIVSALSRVLTLESGDIIATGTPDGVGFARTPPEFLQPGDVVRAEVEGLGELRNVVRDVRQG